MGYLLKSGTVFTGGSFKKADVLVENGHVYFVDSRVPLQGVQMIDINGKYVFPGFVDVHVHLREPGFSYKETIRTGTMAAARGGYTAVCPMPNLKPVPDRLEHLDVQREIIARDAQVRVYPYGAITRGEGGTELSDMEAMEPFVAGFSDDGRGVQSGEMMELAMRRARALDKVIAAHCEDESLLSPGWSVNMGAAERLGLVGNSPESEWRQVERDLRLAESTGCAYHVCHVSTKESVELIKRAKAGGVNVTCETGPHYLVLNDGMLEDDGRFRMNPPIRSEEDRRALMAGLLDGTVDMIATDHAPHSKEEKSRGLAGSLNGIVGLECAFPVLYTELVRKNVLPLGRLIELMSAAPARRFGLPGGELENGGIADLTVFDLGRRYEIQSGEFLSMGRATPFEGREAWGRCMMTVCGGEIVWQEG